VAVSVPLVEPVGCWREQDSHHVVEFFLKVRPVKHELACLHELKELLSVFVIESAVREILWDVPGEIDRVFTDEVHSVGVRPDIRVLHTHVSLADRLLSGVLFSASRE